MIVVSGCPRSGTSLTMELLRKTFGDERIRGAKFPQMARDMEKAPGETDEAFGYRIFVAKVIDPDAELRLEKMIDMNPNGFWENPFTVGGIRYSLGMARVFKELLEENPPSICKVVSQGLAKSDPQYIDKVIYLLRDPASVAKSQERLRREMFVEHPETGERINFWEGVQIVEPRMFIDVSLMAAQWFKANPDVPVLFVSYDELVTYPNDTLLQIEEFLGEGDFSKAAGVVDTSLNRSSNHELEHPMAAEAMDIYRLMGEQDWDGVISYARARDTERALEVMQWECLRRGCLTNTMMCRLCKEDSQMRESFKKAAEQLNVDWRAMPCGFDCGMGCGNDKPITVEESIKNNHWL